MSENILIAIKNVGDKNVTLEYMKHSLKNMQEIVGGYIEAVALPNDVTMWVNEEGLINGLDRNFVTFVSELGVPMPVPVHDIRGNVFFSSVNEMGDTVGLSVDQIKYIKNMFRIHPEICIVRE